jgi:hypothetical protein
VSLDGTQDPDGIDLEGIRIGLNGAEAPVGQAFANLDAAISSAIYTPETGQPLASLGTVISLEKGPNADEFFLTFDRIGANTYARPPAVTPPPPVPVDLPPASDVGVRTFDEISASMAIFTGVSQLDAGVQGTFGTVRQSLPAVPKIEAVLASHQVSIAQLAIEYCNAVVEDPVARTALWGVGFPWLSPPSIAFPASQDALFDPLLDRVLGVTQIATQPDRAAVEAELDELINGIPSDPTRPGLANNPNYPDDFERTEDIGKAVCSAVLGGAAMLVQ